MSAPAEARVQQRQSKVVWFEIPAADFNRAVRFYNEIFQISLKVEKFGNDTLGIFSYEPPAISGCIIAHQTLQPGKGPLVYLNADPNLDAVLARVEAAGGKIETPKTALPGDMGVYARMVDPEGNLVGLHAIS